MKNVFKKLGAALALATGLAIMTSSAPARADVSTASVAKVDYSNDVLILRLSGSPSVTYWGTVNAGGSCGTTHNVTVETIRAWAGMGQAALLAGKNVEIHYTLCGGRNYIASVVLQQ